MRSGKIRIRKVSTDSNWADLGTKSLSGQRVGDLLRIMPLCRRGLVVACLVSCMAGAKAQQDHEEQWWPFMLHMLFVHILAVIAVIQGMMPLCSRRRSTAIQQVNVTRSIGVQTDDCHGGGAEKSSSSVASASLLRMRNQTPTSEDQVYLIGKRCEVSQENLWNCTGQHPTRWTSESSFTQQCHFGKIHCMWSMRWISFTSAALRLATQAVEGCQDT